MTAKVRSAPKPMGGLRIVRFVSFDDPVQIESSQFVRNLFVGQNKKNSFCITTTATFNFIYNL